MISLFDTYLLSKVKCVVWYTWRWGVERRAYWRWNHKYALPKYCGLTPVLQVCSLFNLAQVLRPHSRPLGQFTTQPCPSTTAASLPSSRSVHFSTLPKYCGLTPVFQVSSLLILLQAVPLLLSHNYLNCSVTFCLINFHCFHGNRYLSNRLNEKVFYFETYSYLKNVVKYRTVPYITILCPCKQCCESGMIYLWSGSDNDYSEFLIRPQYVERVWIFYRTTGTLLKYQKGRINQLVPVSL